MIGLIFVAAFSPKLVVANLILFFTIAIVTMFIGLLLWGFIAGEKGFEFEKAPKGLKWFIGIVIAIAVIAGLLWAANVSLSIFENTFSFLFMSQWSSGFWINFFFIAVVIITIAWVLKSSKASK